MLLTALVSLASGLTAIVHVGPQKTGSTSLQTALKDHRKSLARDNFDLVPKRFAGGHVHWTGPKSGANGSAVRTGGWSARQVATCLDRLSRNQASYEQRMKNIINCTRALDQFENFLDHARLANRLQVERDQGSLTEISFCLLSCLVTF